MARTLSPLATLTRSAPAPLKGLAKMAQVIPASSSTTRTAAAGRWPLMVSLRTSSLETPSSMSTNRNSTMMAPAYTITWTTARNCACSST
jgi:hypothetical protein